jgi:hypothetical protein
MLGGLTSLLPAGFGTLIGFETSPLFGAGEDI